MIDPLLTGSAQALARRIAAREITARAVVAAHIRRIEAVNAVVNALVHDRFDALGLPSNKQQPRGLHDGEPRGAGRGDSFVTGAAEDQIRSRDFPAFRRRSD